MNKLNFIKEALFELLGNRVDFLKQKFIDDFVKYKMKKSLDSYPNLDKDTLRINFTSDATREFILLEQADPTKNKQYLQWIIAQYKKELISGRGVYRFFEDLPKLTSRLEIFHDLGVHKKLQGKDKDINNYVIDFPSDDEEHFKLRQKGIKSLEELTEPYMKIDSDLTQYEQDVVNEQAKKIWDGEEWTIYIPQTELSACVLGKDTDWCTTYGYEGGRYPTRTGNMFDTYSREGNLYILVNKKSGERYQFHFPSDQFMDSSDSQIDLDEFINDNPELDKAFNFILPEIKKDAVETIAKRGRSDEVGQWIDNEVESYISNSEDELDTIIRNVYESYAQKNNLNPDELISLLNERGITKQLQALPVPTNVDVNESGIDKLLQSLQDRIKKAQNFDEVITALREAPSSHDEYYYDSSLYQEIANAVYVSFRKPLEQEVTRAFNSIMRNNKNYLQREQQGQMNLFAIKAMLEKLLK